MNLFTIISFLIITFNFKHANSSHPVRECDPVEDSQNDLKCYNGGVCLQFEINSTSIMKMCNCKPGFTGRQCSQRTMPCSPDPCAPNGYCNSEEDSSRQGDNSLGYFCRCKPGYTGVNCQENINDCLNATCYNGGSCIDGINSYECDCKWPYIGRYCQTRMKCNNDFVCKNNGICVDDEDEIESNPVSNDYDENEWLNKKLKTGGPRCICQKSYEGNDCSIRVDQCKSQPCMHGGKCIRLANKLDYKCECKNGRYGKNCEHDDVCWVKMPCKNNATCINLTTNTTSANYVCQCKPLYTGINCDVKLPCEYGSDCFKSAQIKSGLAKLNQIRPLKHNLDDIITKQTEIESKLVTKINITTKTQTNTTTTSNTIQSNTTPNSNGSFVLVVNIPPDEFKRRQVEITREFEKKFGILLSIKKEQNSINEMIYPFRPSNQPNSDQTWTKVYFVIIFACVFDQNELPIKFNNNNISSMDGQNSLCLFSNSNNQTEILDQFNKMSNLLPKYVNNITYEAYSDSYRRNKPIDDSNDSNSKSKHVESNVSTTLVAFMAISLLVLISLISLVLIRQKRVKAPIWFPPLGDNVNPNALGKSCDYNPANIEMMVSGSMSNKKQQFGLMANSKTTSWSLGKKFDEISTFFFPSSKQINKNEDSPTSDKDSSEYNEYADIKPAKMMRLDPIYSTVNHNSSNTSSITPNSSTTTATTTTSATPSLLLLPPPPPPQINQQQSNQNSSDTPEYYPSPPESLPDASFTQQTSIYANHNNQNNLLNPVNFKGAGYGITPLSIFVVSRSKVKNGTNKPQNINGDLVESDVIDTLVANGADLNAYDSNGETALHLAARCGLYEICDSLIKNGADLTMFDNQGRNILHTAVCGNQYSVVKLILNYCSILNNGSNQIGSSNQQNLLLDSKYNLIDSKTNDELGETPLIFAARLGLNDILKLLIDFNATVNATDNEGKGPLHHCAQVNNALGAQILLQAKANGNAQDNNEKTPLTTALDELCTIEVADILLKNDVFVSSEDEYKYNKMKSILSSLNNNDNSNQCGYIQSTKDLDKKSVYVMQPTKENQINIKKSSNKAAKANTNNVIEHTTSTKRKLSDTYNSNTLIINNNSNKKQYKTDKQNSGKQINATNPPVYTPLTPSPPQTLPQNNQINQYQDYSSGYYSSKSNDYPFNGQESTPKQFYLSSSTNSAFSYAYDNTCDQNKIELNYNNGGANLNLAYLNENNSNNNLNYFNNYQTANTYQQNQSNNQYISEQTQYQQQQQQVNPYQKNNIYSSQNLYFGSETYAAYF